MALQEQNYSRLLSDVTKLVIEVNEPAQASEAMARAFHVAESGTPGPVAIVIPEDVFDAETEAAPAAPRPAALAGPRPEDLDRLADMLAKAERPLVWVGGAVHPADVPDVARLAESWMLPVMPTHRRPHLFDPAHPNYGGYMSGRVHRRRNGLARSRPTCWSRSASAWRYRRRKVSPSRPRPTRKCRWCMSGPDPKRSADLPARARHGVRAGRGGAGAAGDHGAPAGAEKRKGWVEQLHAVHQKISKPEWQPTSDGVNFSAVIAAVGRHLKPDATVTTDAGNFSSFVQRYLQMKAGTDVSELGGRGDGGGDADGGGRGAAPARHTGGRLRRRRRRADDRQRAGDRAPIRGQPGVHRLRQRLLRHDHPAPRHALSRPPVPGGDAAHQPRFRALGDRVRRQGDDDQARRPRSRTRSPRRCRPTTVRSSSMSTRRWSKSAPGGGGARRDAPRLCNI